METRNAVLPAELLTSLPSVVNLPQNETRLGHRVPAATTPT